MTLTDDERIVLEIAGSGAALMPIGRWREAVLALAKRGWLKPGGDGWVGSEAFNYVVTEAGRAAWAAWNKAETEELRGAAGRAGRSGP